MGTICDRDQIGVRNGTKLRGVFDGADCVAPSGLTAVNNWFLVHCNGL